MNQVGGVASYKGNFWYNQETNASDGNQEADFQELVGDTGKEARGNKEPVDIDRPERGEKITRQEVPFITYDYFGKVQSREQNDGTSVNIIA